MKLSQLLSPWFRARSFDCEVLGLQNDSRLIRSGDLFVAYPGSIHDGRLFIDKALSLGAVAVAYDPDNVSMPLSSDKSIPMVAVPNLSRQLAHIAKRFYNNPSRALKITGITGTNGKTTIAYQLAEAHQLLGQKAAYIGTIGQGQIHQLKPLNNTTPDALSLLKYLDEYKHQGITQVAMEVSSHALSQARVDAVEFEQAIYTNLSLDHLDYHKTMENYAASKAQLFAKEELQWAIINQDCSYAHLMAANIKAKVISYGIQQQADIKALNWQTDVNGSEIQIESFGEQYQIKTKTLGLFNVYNSLAVFASLLLSDYSAKDLIPLMFSLKAAPGRMERVSDSPSVFVDYAHTPDALKNTLATLNQLKKGHLWVVFGCGGDRDKTKRAVMGEVASLYADHVVVTSDNPRSEDPGFIIKDIVQSISPKKLTTLIHREEAIAYALDRVEKDDIILIAGKGHEAYQQIGDVKEPFSDQEVVSRLLKK